MRLLGVSLQLCGIYKQYCLGGMTVSHGFISWETVWLPLEWILPKRHLTSAAHFANQFPGSLLSLINTWGKSENGEQTRSRLPKEKWGDCHRLTCAACTGDLGQSWGKKHCEESEPQKDLRLQPKFQKLVTQSRFNYSLLARLWGWMEDSYHREIQGLQDKGSSSDKFWMGTYVGRKHRSPQKPEFHRGFFFLEPSVQFEKG